MQLRVSLHRYGGHHSAGSRAVTEPLVHDGEPVQGVCSAPAAGIRVESDSAANTHAT